MKRIFFFATPSDIVPVLSRYEANAPLKFVEMGVLKTPNRQIYLQSSDIRQPGISTHETGSMSQGYMVSHRDTKNHMNAFVDRKGEKRWSLDNGDNQEAVVLVMAGVWKTGTLLPGNISTLHDGAASLQLMQWFLTALKQEKFKKIRDWWVGGEALKILETGGRLTTTAEQSPPDFDLKLKDDVAN